MVTGDQDTLYLWPAWLFVRTILICGIPFKAMMCVCVFALYTVFFSPSFIHAILVLYNCVCMSLHVLLCVVCMPCSVMAFEWSSHVLWCHEYYCTGSVWFSRNFIILENSFTLSSLPHSTHLMNLLYALSPSMAALQFCLQLSEATRT